MTRTPRRQHQAEGLEVVAFCTEGSRLEGERALSALPRLAEAVRRGDDGFADAAVVRWSAIGATPPQRGGAARWVIALALEADVMLECQRCLQPVAVPLRVHRQVMFVRGEDEAARLDEELEDDVLALPARLDLFTLIEDELLLALPLVPRHDACPRLPGLAQQGDNPAPPPTAGPEAARHRPFAVLGELTKARKPEPGGGTSGGHRA